MLDVGVCTEVPGVDTEHKKICTLGLSPVSSSSPELLPLQEAPGVTTEEPGVFCSEQVVSNRADSACVLWPETDTLTSLVI